MLLSSRCRSRTLTTFRCRAELALSPGAWQTAACRRWAAWNGELPGLLPSSVAWSQLSHPGHRYLWLALLSCCWFQTHVGCWCRTESGQVCCKIYCTRAWGPVHLWASVDICGRLDWDFAVVAVNCDIPLESIVVIRVNRWRFCETSYFLVARWHWCSVCSCTCKHHSPHQRRPCLAECNHHHPNPDERSSYECHHRHLAERHWGCPKITCTF